MSEDYKDYAGDFDFVVPDVFHKLGIADKEYAIYMHYDRVDYFEFLGAWALMIQQVDDEGTQAMIWTEEANIVKLLETTDLGVNARPCITEAEYASYLGWMASKLTDADYGIVDNGFIEEEE